MKTRKEMVDYLSGHFRYNTMNSWNGCSSYAVKMKIWDFVPNNLRNKAFELLDLPEVFDTINDTIEEWGIKNNYTWQAGFNGRSGGYLVLYSGGAKPSEYKSRCYSCGQGNCTLTKDTGTKCGRCGENTRHDYEKIPLIPFTTGKGIDEGEDFIEWDAESIRERYKLIKDFDKLAKDCQKEFLYYCKHFKVEEVEEEVTKTVKRKQLVEVNENV